MSPRNTELDLSGLSQSQLWTRLENNDPRFRDLRELGWAAANGGCANTTVTIAMGRQLLVLLIEAQQYREAHAHSQELRSKAEQEAGQLHDALREVLDACDRFVMDRNLYAFSVHCDGNSNPRKVLDALADPSLAAQNAAPDQRDIRAEVADAEIADSAPPVA